MLSARENNDSNLSKDVAPADTLGGVNGALGGGGSAELTPEQQAAVADAEKTALEAEALPPQIG